MPPPPRRSAILSWVFACLLVTGCQQGVNIERGPRLGYDDAIVVSNGDVRLVVVPAIGRVMRYGPVNGPEMLWRQDDPKGYASQFGGFRNFGGDKVWIWPQDLWTWPPPPAIDAGPYTAIIDGSELLLTSPVDPVGGVQVTRRIHLADAGSVVDFITTVTRVAEGPSRGLAPWTIAQVREPPAVVGYIPPKFRELRPISTPGQGIWSVDPIAGKPGWVVATPPRPKSAKVMFPGALLAWVERGRIFMIQGDGIDKPGDKPAERAQLYCHDLAAGTPAPDVGIYIEVEFTAQPRVLTMGQSHTLRTRWQLIDAPDSPTPAAVADAIAARLAR